MVKSLKVRLTNLLMLTEWDSMNINPYGILYGTRYQLGNFDQCLSTPWVSKESTLQSQYCLVDVRLGTKKINKTAQALFDPVDPYIPTRDFIDVII